jgi:hypothetical protein
MQRWQDTKGTSKPNYIPYISVLTEACEDVIKDSVVERLREAEVALTREARRKYASTRPEKPRKYK